MHRKTKVFLMPESKKIALLMDGPNIGKYCFGIGAYQSEAYGKIMEIARTYGNVKTAVIYYSIEARKHPGVLSDAIRSGFNPLIGSGSRETLDIDKKLICDARKYIKGNEIDTIVLAAGDGHYIGICEETLRCGKEFMLIYPPGDTHHHFLKQKEEGRIVAVELVLTPRKSSEVNNLIVPAARPCSQNYRP
jgi:uncharacterized protein (TIGR00288 family)